MENEALIMAFKVLVIMGKIFSSFKNDTQVMQIAHLWPQSSTFVLWGWGGSVDLTVGCCSARMNLEGVKEPVPAGLEVLEAVPHPA